MQRSKTIVSGFLSLILLGFAGWYYVGQQVGSLLYQGDNKAADAILNGITAKQYNASGELVSKLSSSQLRHFPSDNHAEFKRPDIAIYRADKQSPWRIQSKQGLTRNNNKEIIFQGNVVIRQAASKHNANTVIHTEKMRYFPDQQLALTDSPVTINRAGSVIHAKGLQANLRTGKIQLAQAEGQYRARQ